MTRVPAGGPCPIAGDNDRALCTTGTPRTGAKLKTCGLMGCGCGCPPKGAAASDPARGRRLCEEQSQSLFHKASLTSFAKCWRSSFSTRSSPSTLCSRRCTTVSSLSWSSFHFAARSTTAVARLISPVMERCVGKAEQVSTSGWPRGEPRGEPRPRLDARPGLLGLSPAASWAEAEPSEDRRPRLLERSFFGIGAARLASAPDIKSFIFRSAASMISHGVLGSRALSMLSSRRGVQEVEPGRRLKSAACGNPTNGGTRFATSASDRGVAAAALREESCPLLGAKPAPLRLVRGPRAEERASPWTRSRSCSRFSSVMS
mmetsp:Transcript_50129/g.144160  ORF Transcript_50129/g.144160 Transcript_50129/m.144160 type:complete len:317 (-) Transcript_50129:520-1470(-)